MSRASGEKVLVNSNQRGNPLLRHLPSHAFEYGDLRADYQIGRTAVVFITLRYTGLSSSLTPGHFCCYHLTFKEYLNGRLRALANTARVHVLLVQCDIEDSAQPLEQIMTLCVDHGFALLLCWSPSEAAAYLASLLKHGRKGLEALQGLRKDSAHPFALACSALTQVRSINRSDVATLLSTFGSFRRLADVTEEDLSSCPGFGDRKIKRLLAVLSAPFPGSAAPPAAPNLAEVPAPSSSSSSSSSGPTSSSMPMEATAMAQSRSERASELREATFANGHATMLGALQRALSADEDDPS
eukprot:RCo008888